MQQVVYLAQARPMLSGRCRDRLGPRRPHEAGRLESFAGFGDDTMDDVGEEPLRVDDLELVGRHR